MFGLAKKKVHYSQAARLMAAVVIMPMVNPSKQDSIFIDRAFSSGANKIRFVLELVAFQVFVMSAVVNRERLERRMSEETMRTLIPEFLRSVHHQLKEVESQNSEALPLDVDTIFALISKRSDTYFNVALENIPRTFAICCVDAASEPIERIGSSLLLIRGNEHGEWFKGIKLV